MQPKHPLADCSNCPLATSPCVPSYLPAHPALLVVGEAPGRTEVEEGKPFVGRSGMLLDAAIRQAGFDPATVARTNAVLCRPQNNATPPVQAVEACRKRLEADIRASSAQRVLALGSVSLHAVQAILGGSSGSITSVRGQWLPISPAHNLAALATFHPAYILRNPNIGPQFVADVARALQPSRQPFNPREIKYTVVSNANLAKVVAHLETMRNGAYIAFDVETEGLQWYTTSECNADRVIALGISWQKNRVLVVPHDMLHNPTLRAAILSALQRGKPVAHNAKFDQHFLAKYKLSFNVAFDTMLAHYTLDETKGTHDLKQLIVEWLECTEDYEKRLVKDFFVAHGITQSKRKYSLLPVAQLYEYLAIDVTATLLLAERLEAALRHEKLYDAPFLDVIMPVANAIFQVEENGIAIDRAYVAQLQSYLTEQLHNIARLLQQQVHTRVKQWLVRGGIKLPRAKWITDRAIYARCIEEALNDFNPNSWQQLQIYLYDVLGLTHSQRLSYKTDPRSTNKEALLSLQPSDKTGFVTQLLEYRRLEKIRGTYTEKLLQLADTSDRVHIDYLIHGTEIGRLSASDAMHGIPRPSDQFGKAIRGSFVATPGNVLIIADYSQAELRVFAAESKEPTMLEAYNNGKDLHNETAKMIAPAVISYFGYDFNDPTTPENIRKEIRTLAKNINFGEIYQGGAYGITAMLGGKLPVGVVGNILDIKRQRQTVAAQWKIAQFNHARTYGFVQSRFGRKRRFSLITDHNLDEVKKASCHMPIASGASDLTLLSIVQLVSMGYKVCGTWHDSLIIEIDAALAEQAAQTVQQVMVETGQRYFPEVEWKVDVDIAQRWYEDIPEWGLVV